MLARRCCLTAMDVDLLRKQFSPAHLTLKAGFSAIAPGVFHR